MIVKAINMILNSNTVSQDTEACISEVIRTVEIRKMCNRKDVNRMERESGEQESKTNSLKRVEWYSRKSWRVNWLNIC